MFVNIYGYKFTSKSLSIFHIQNLKVVVLENPQTRTINSKFSRTGKTNEFVMNCLVGNEVRQVRTFKEETAKKFTKLKKLKLYQVHDTPYGLEMKKETMVNINLYKF